jgi:heat shock protein HslJ
MMTRTFSRFGIGFAWALVTLACGGSTELTQSTPPLETVSTVPSPSRSGLIGSWQLVSLAEAGQAPVSVPEPERFTVEFGADERASLRADCNRCSFGYTATSESLAVGLMACTVAQCGSAPLDSRFVGLVGRATTWTAAHGGLELRSDAGLLRLRAVTPR